MKKRLQFIYSLLFILATALVITGFTTVDTTEKGIKFPYRQAGLTERQAAAHLLSRFTFGTTPNQIDALVHEGLEKWFAAQLTANLANDSLDQKLAPYETLTMSNEAIVKTFPPPGQIIKMAVKEGLIDKDSVNKTDKKAYREKLTELMQKNGFKPQQELYRQLINQKILRAAYSNNQLQEVLTNFWFNHFNVSLTKNECAHYVMAYERDVIRPNVFGKFETLLLATAKSPAMLTYLDNARSVANDNTPVNIKLATLFAKQIQSIAMADSNRQQMTVIDKIQKAKKAQGLNENYAREIMELHTLGVDGGYTQDDVTNAAKVLTGWTLNPSVNVYGGQVAQKIIDKIGEERLIKQGFIHDGDFMFNANKHDKTEKIVLGQTFTANGGYDEGLKLIGMLAHNNATANFICKKLAIRFVSDAPSKTLVDKMAKTFLNNDGDIKQVLITMVNAPEFWNKNALREKTKSPFELAISTVRSCNAQITQPFQLYNWITKMGERMYYYQAPTGFPDKGQYWINTGSLLNRMNFGLALASQKIPGVTFNLAALNNNHEPESLAAALTIYGKILMPERNLDETIKRLSPLINDPELNNKITTAANNTPVQQSDNTAETKTSDNTMIEHVGNGKQKIAKENFGKKQTPNISMQQMMAPVGNNSMLSQVTGIIIGSPEFQRK